jgi:hypothetical protein
MHYSTDKIREQSAKRGTPYVIFASNKNVEEDGE